MPQNKKPIIQFQWHPIGQRIIKTAAAVTVCLFFYMLRGYQGNSMPAEAAITAIICMQPYLHDTRENALSRLIGTLVGALWGFLFLVLLLAFPALGYNLPVLYLLMGVGTLVALYSTVLMSRQDASGLAAIVFVCVVIAYPDITNPMDQAFHRILDVLVGTATALGINAIRLPRVKQNNKVFFVRTCDLAADQLAQLDPGVLFRMQNLFREGAKICLMSEHAPAFHTSQLGLVPPTVPMIVMDGAAVYDASENAYLSVTNLPPASSRWLIKRLESLKTSFLVCTVHRDRNCIYHHGPLTDMERQIYQHLKKSPYRYYLDDDHYAASDIVYIKIVASRQKVDHIRRELQPMLGEMKLRCAVRPQAGIEDGFGLYFYAEHADMAHAQAHVMRLLRRTEPGLESREMTAEQPYRTEQDAIRLLRRLSREYEPVMIPRRRTAEKQ